MAPRKLKQQHHQGTVANVEDALNALRDDLGNEMREWYDNMSENLQGGDKGSAVDEAASTLEGLDELTVPDILSGLGIDYTTQHKGGKKGDPRWLRRDNELAVLHAAEAAVRQWVDHLEELLSDDSGEDRPATVEFKGNTLTFEELEEGLEEAKTFADELADVISTAETVEFPGMYG